MVLVPVRWLSNGSVLVLSHFGDVPLLDLSRYRTVLTDSEVMELVRDVEKRFVQVLDRELNVIAEEVAKLVLKHRTLSLLIRLAHAKYVRDLAKYRKLLEQAQAIVSNYEIPDSYRRVVGKYVGLVATLDVFRLEKLLQHLCKKYVGIGKRLLELADPRHGIDISLTYVKYRKRNGLWFYDGEVVEQVKLWVEACGEELLCQVREVLDVCSIFLSH